MKVITVMQPWAALIAHGIKTIETRPAPPNGDMRPDGVRGLPGLAVNRGERIAIHAAAKAPVCGEDVGDWYWEDTPADPECIVGPDGIHPAPLGAVVATAVVADALPILGGAYPDPDPDPLFDLADRMGRCLTAGDGTVLYLDRWPDEVGAPPRIDLVDQLPLGDFTPGRWGWLLTDVQALPEPIPATGRQGVWEWAR